MTETNTSGSKIDVELSELTEAVDVNPSQIAFGCGSGYCALVWN